MCSTVPIRLERGARHLHRLGPRAIAEALAEIGRRAGAEAEVLAVLDAWRRLDPAALALVLAAYCSDRDFPTHVSEVPRYA